MFAIFLSEKMDPFYQLASSFPTAIFTFFLILTLLFWCIAVLGLVDIDFLGGTDIDTGALEADTATVPDGIAGVILKLNLHDVPVTISLTLIAVFAWFFSYYFVYFSEAYIPAGILSLAANMGIFLVSLFLGLKITIFCIKPLRPLFQQLKKTTEQYILGQTAVVRSSRVDHNFGEAVVEDGGAGLILKVRTHEDTTFTKGDRVVLLAYQKEQNTYSVIAEKDFLK